MELKRGFKQTEVGIIPDDWIVQKLEEIGRVIRGASPRPKGDKRFYGGIVPRLMVEDVTRDGKYVTPIVDFLTVEGAKRSRPCKKGTLTVVCSGTVGIPSFLAVDACIHDGFLALVDIDKKVNDDYLYHQLFILRDKFENSATHGGVFTNLTTEIFRSFLIPLPPTIKEQSAIAAALSDVDALLTSLDALIAKKRAIKQGAMQELLTGKTRLPGFSGEWKVKKLGEILKLHYGQSQKGISSLGGEFPILGTGGIVGSTNYYMYDLPSVIIGRKGTIDIPQYVDTPFWAIDTTYFTEVGKLAHPKFLYYLFTTINWYSYNEASGVPSLSAPTLEKIELRIPKEPEQRAIAVVLSDMDTETHALELQREKTRMLKKGMMQELLTGRTRLV